MTSFKKGRRPDHVPHARRQDGVGFLLSLEALEDRIVPTLLVLDGDRIRSFNEVTGALVGTFATPKGEYGMTGMTVGPDGNVYVSTWASGTSGLVAGPVLRYDPTGLPLPSAGNSDAVFISADVVSGPGRDIAVGANNDLYLLDYYGQFVSRYNTITGNLTKIITLPPTDPNTGALAYGSGIALAPDGSLYASIVDVYGFELDRIVRYTGTGWSHFASTSNSSRNENPYDLTFGPDGNVYVAAADVLVESVLRFSADGEALGRFVDVDAWDCEFGPDGMLYLSDVNGLVSRYMGLSNAKGTPVPFDNVPGGTSGFFSFAALAFVPSPIFDVEAESLTWNTTEGGVDLRYSLTGFVQIQDAKIEFYWATSDRVADIIGGPVASVDVAIDHGTHQERLTVAQLRSHGDVPGNATHLIARINLDGPLSETYTDNNDTALGIPLTVITHGFQPFGPVDPNAPQWAFDMAKAINNRVYFGLFTNAQIENSVVAYSTQDPFPPSSGAAAFLVFNWAAVSSLDSPGTADDGNVAGTLAQLVRFRLSLSGQRDIHFIGHSRGAYVNAAAIELLHDPAVMSRIDTLQMTTFDPQNYGDDGGGGEEGRLVVPTNVDYADNYFQTLPTLFGTPLSDDILGGGRLVSSGSTRILNLDITYPLSLWDSGLNDHSETWFWYHHTINLTIAPGLRDLLFNNSFNLDFSGDGAPDPPDSGRNLGFAWAVELHGVLPAGRDLDGDGVSDDVEGRPTGSGDGNGDGIPDSQQANVSSLLNAVGQYITFVSSPGTQLKNVTASADPPALPLPSGIAFPHGFFTFQIKVSNPGDSATVTILSNGLPFAFYEKYGKTPDDPTPHWYLFDLTGGTGADTFDPYQVVLHFIDGGRGDGDLMANGVIDDPGGLAVFTYLPPLPHPTRVPLFAAGAGPGGGPHVRVYNADGSERFSFFAYDRAFTGGVTVATGDVTGDGVDDIVTGALAGGGPHVKVFDGATGQEVRSWMAFDAAFTAGVSVAVGDVNDDGYADIVVGAGTGAGPHVRVFSGFDGSELMSFFAYDAGFRGGVSVAVADGKVVTGVLTGAPHLKVFDGMTGEVLRSFWAFDTAHVRGMNVAAGDLNGDGATDFVFGQSGGGVVTILDGASGQSRTVRPFESYPGGVRGAVKDLNGDGQAELLTSVAPIGAPDPIDSLVMLLGSTPRPSGGPRVRAFHANGGDLFDFFAFDPAFTGGVSVG